MASVLGLDLNSLGGIGLLVVVAAMVFTESGILLGLLLPGDTILFGAGLLTARPSLGLSPVVLAVVVVVAASGGGVLAWATGRRLGPPLLAKRVKPEHLARAVALNERYGVLALVATRWIPWARTLLPHVAGAAGMPWRRFLLADVVGAVTWGATLVTLGRLSADVPALKTIAAAVAGTFVGGSVVLGVVLVVRRRRSAGRGPEPGHGPLPGDLPEDLPEPVPGDLLQNLPQNLPREGPAGAQGSGSSLT